MFGDRRLAEAIAQCSDLEPALVAERIAESVAKFTGSHELQDDLTLLVARRL
jgi:serine phosphatase RsbU (regulator of sigma subunit)